MKGDPTFDLVVFDLGGVLVRTARSWEEAHRLAGLSGDPPTAPEFRRVVEELGRRADGSLAARRFYADVASASEGHYRPEDVERIGHAWLQGEYDGVETLFDALEGTPVDLALLSNTNDAHWERLVLAESASEFPNLRRARHRFASHLLGLMKPDPAIYEVVVRRTGHAPSRILFFDDLEENVEGARRAGWTAERIDPERHPARQLREALWRHGVLSRE